MSGELTRDDTYVSLDDEQDDPVILGERIGDMAADVIIEAAGKGVSDWATFYVSRSLVAPKGFVSFIVGVRNVEPEAETTTPGGADG